MGCVCPAELLWVTGLGVWLHTFIPSGFFFFVWLLLLVVALPYCVLIRQCFSSALLRAKMSLSEAGGRP